MTDLRDTLRNCKFIRSLVYHFRLFREHGNYCSGNGNKVTINGIKVGTKIQVNGDDNRILVNNKAILKNAKVFIRGNHNKIIIRTNAFLEGTMLHIEDNNCLLIIGENTFVGASHLDVTEDGRSIVVGENCMLSSNIYIRTGDSHSIVDIEGKRINPAKCVSIGDHCWIGEGAKILKGVTLQKDTIVATGAIVTRSFSSGCVIGGNPARIIKENVNWDKQRL